jgi:tryptophanyl-tRNA synthetase
MRRGKILKRFGRGYGELKVSVGEAVAETLRPIREEYARIMADKAYLKKVYTDGAAAAASAADGTLRKVYEKIGFITT